MNHEGDHGLNNLTLDGEFLVYTKGVTRTRIMTYHSAFVQVQVSYNERGCWSFLWRRRIDKLNEYQQQL